ncbi:hypothetical protein C6P77_13430 [Burkholderia ambifaria]|nr:hypothetical protein C6P77_13430 [Burkholderia ambifaria]
MVEDGGSVDGGHDGCLDRADEKTDDTPMDLRPGRFGSPLPHPFRARFRCRLNAPPRSGFVGPSDTRTRSAPAGGAPLIRRQ